MVNTLIDGGSHVDRALSNIAVQAFEAEGSDFIAPMLFPAVPVEKQSDGYYVIDPASWLRVENTRRSPKAPANAGEWKVSTATYFAQNWAFRTDHALETLSNADAALRIRQGSTEYVVSMLKRDMEVRVANQVTSISNVGSGVILSGNSLWSDFVNSDPISDVKTGHAFIENNTGLSANTAAMDKDTYRMLKIHPVIRDYAKQTIPGPVPDTVLKELFEVENLWVAKGIRNTANEGATATFSNIWGNNFLLARIDRRPVSLKTATLGLGMRWQPEGFPAGMAVERYRDGDPSTKKEWIESQFFQDEKIVASDLGYLISTTL